MVNTFVELCNYSDWTIPVLNKPVEETTKTKTTEKESKDTPKTVNPTKSFDLNYDIHIHLPATRDQAVYDALFASLAKHLSNMN